MKIWKCDFNDWLKQVRNNPKFCDLDDAEIYDIWCRTPYPERPFRRSAQYDLVCPFEFSVEPGERVVVPFPFMMQEDFPVDCVVQIYSLVDRTLTMYDCTDSIEGNCFSTTIQCAGHYEQGMVISTCTVQKTIQIDNDAWLNPDFISRSHRKYTGYAKPLFNEIGNNSKAELKASRVFNELPSSNHLGLESADR